MFDFSFLSTLIKVSVTNFIIKKVAEIALNEISDVKYKIYRIRIKFTIQNGLSCSVTRWDQELSLDARPGEGAPPHLAIQTFFWPLWESEAARQVLDSLLFAAPVRLRAPLGRLYARTKSLFTEKPSEYK